MIELPHSITSSDCKIALTFFIILKFLFWKDDTIDMFASVLVQHLLKKYRDIYIMVKKQFLKEWSDWFYSLYTHSSAWSIFSDPTLFSSKILLTHPFSLGCSLPNGNSELRKLSSYKRLLNLMFSSSIVSRCSSGSIFFYQSSFCLFVMNKQTWVTY